MVSPDKTAVSCQKSDYTKFSTRPQAAVRQGRLACRELLGHSSHEKYDSEYRSETNRNIARIYQSDAATLIALIYRPWLRRIFACLLSLKLLRDKEEPA